jgi:hypothetical protein
MPPMERPAKNDVPKEEHQETAVSRRQLLKALIATGGAITASTLLPAKWSKPIVEVGMLPVHAQISPPLTPTPTPEPPTETPGPIASITGCSAFNASGATTIGPSDVIETYTDITPTLSGIELRRTITLHQTSHPRDGIVATDTGLTDSAGRFQPPNFDLGTLSPTILAGDGRLTILWEFVNPADGTNDCQNIIDIV